MAAAGSQEQFRHSFRRERNFWRSFLRLEHFFGFSFCFLGEEEDTSGKRKRNRWLSQAHAEQPLGIDDRSLDTLGEARHPKLGQHLTRSAWNQLKEVPISRRFGMQGCCLCPRPGHESNLLYSH